MNSDFQVPTRVPLILRLPSPSPGNDASYFNSAQPMDKLGKNETFFDQKQHHDFATPSKSRKTCSPKSRKYSLHTSNVQDNNISSSLRNSSFDSEEVLTIEDNSEDDKSVDEDVDHEADERGSSVGENIDDIEGSTIRESDSEDSDMSNEDEEDGNFDVAHENNASEEEMEQEDDVEEDEHGNIAGINHEDDSSEDDESDSKEFQLINHIPTGKRLAPDDDEDSESDRDRPDVIVVFTGELAIPVESSIGNISSEDEISSDDNDNNSTGSSSSSCDEMSSASESSNSSLHDEDSVHEPKCDVENHFSDMSDNESENASGINEEDDGVTDNESSCADISDNDCDDSDSNSEFSCNSSLEDSDASDNNSEASSEQACESLGSNILGQSTNNENEEDVEEYIGFTKGQGTGREQLQMIEKLSQTDSISIEELEDIINASPKEDDISEFDMNFSDSEKQPATWPEDSECESNHKSSNKSPREEFENRQTISEDYSPNRSTKKVKRNLSCNMLSSLPLPLKSSPKRFRSISTSESTTNEDEEKDTKYRIKSVLPPLPPLGQRDSTRKVHTKSSLSAFCDKFIKKTQTDGKSSQDSSYTSIPLLTPDDSPHVESSEDAGNKSICEWPSNADFDNTITSVFTMKGQSPHSSQGDDKLMSFASPPRINEKEQVSTASCSLTPKLQSISVSFR